VIAAEHGLVVVGKGDGHGQWGIENEAQGTNLGPTSRLKRGMERVRHPLILIESLHP
jgi:hypothetical protein